MVLIKVKDPNTNETYEYSMDNKLKRQLDKKVKGALTKKDEDYVIVIDGEERSGKSVFAIQIARYVDSSLTLDRICFSPDEFRKAILKAKKGECIIFDEAYRGLSAKGALTEINKILVSLMMEMGQKNLFIIIVLPTFYLLEKYVALWRARGLFHIYRKRSKKGYWVFIGRKKKTLLYLKGKKDYSYGYVKSSFKGRFYGKYGVNEEEYRKKKSESFKEGYKTTRQENLMDQRNKLIYLLYKEYKLSQQSISELIKDNGIKISRSGIRDILLKFNKE